MYFVYILRSKVNNSYYIGQTQNLEKRLLVHNKKKGRSTKRYAPYSIVYRKEFKKRGDAVSYELYLKSLKRRIALEKIINDGVTVS